MKVILFDIDTDKKNYNTEEKIINLWYNIKYNNLDLNPVKTLTNYREMYYMKRESEGIVIETSESIAKVRASRHEDCKSCGACAGDNAIVVDAKNPVGAKPGQHVVFEIKDAHMLRAAFIVYILPLIAIFVGALLGTWVGNYVGHSEIAFQIGGGIIMNQIKRMDRRNLLRKKIIQVSHRQKIRKKLKRI